MDLLAKIIRAKDGGYREIKQSTDDKEVMKKKINTIRLFAPMCRSMEIIVDGETVFKK